MTDNTERKPPYSAQEVADTLGVAKSTVIETAQRGELDAFRVGARWLFPASPNRQKGAGGKLVLPPWPGRRVKPRH